jgi:hypothetical protein
MKTIDKIKLLISSLPKSDVTIGLKLLDDRNFSELQNLVDSAIVIIEYNLRGENPKEEYLSINMADLEMLLAMIISYRAQRIEDDDDEVYRVDDKEDEPIVNEEDLC